MVEPLITVIVPIYKVEAYLERAILSITNQTYSHMQIILVDDGSPDNCGSICDTYAKKDKRIQVIHKENGGLSDARNAGLDAAKGDYIAFLDSDDYIAPFFLEVLLRTLNATGSDVALCPYQTVTELEPVEFQPPSKDKEWEKAHYFVYDRKELLLNMYDRNHPDATYFIVAWNKLYKASLWKEIRFPKGKIHEDEATTYKILDKAKKGVYVKCPMYGYFSAPSSITRDAFHIKRLQWMEALTDRIAFFEKQTGEIDLAFFACKARADGAIRYYYPLKEQVKDSEKEQEQLKEYVRAALREQKTYGSLALATRIGYRLFLFWPALYKKLIIS
ncbi:MAG: glycosyltransferase [Lachnospiraceae bacterium]|nr:glycosyltransferase [Lachnospiraceae bacterium]